MRAGREQHYKNSMEMTGASIAQDIVPGTLAQQHTVSQLQRSVLGDIEKVGSGLLDGAFRSSGAHLPKGEEWDKAGCGKLS